MSLMHPLLQSILQAHGAPKPERFVCAMCGALPGHPCSVRCPNYLPLIHTEFVYPPIPVRRFDWRATFDDYEPGCPMGEGPTEFAAIVDLLAQWEPEA